MPKRLKFVTEQWVLFMVRQQTWQARRFKIVESACHFRIQSNLDARFESNLEASQVPNIIIIIITYFGSHWYTTWVLRVAYQETTFRTEIRREVGLGECPKKLGSLLTGCRRSSKTWWWRHNRSCQLIKVGRCRCRCQWRARLQWTRRRRRWWRNVVDVYRPRGRWTTDKRFDWHHHDLTTHHQLSAWINVHVVQ